MADSPLLAAAIAEQLGTGDVEEPPAVDPDLRLGAVDGLEDVADIIGLAILDGEPGFQRLLVVGAVHHPALLEREIVLIAQQQIIGRHGAAGEEVARHPVVLAFILEGIGVLAMGEDMDEEPAIGLEPSGDAAHERLVIAHMLEHFHRHHPGGSAR